LLPANVRSVYVPDQHNLFTSYSHAPNNATRQAEVILISSMNLSKQKSAKMEDLFHYLINILLDECKPGCSTAILLDRQIDDLDLLRSEPVPRESGT
jgi:hypothetical protein